MLRLVRVRRALLALVGIELLAVVVWTAYSLSLEAYFDEGSTNWQRIDDETGPGFVVILSALVATVVVFLLTRVSGPEGRVAARIRPGFADGAEPAVRPRKSAPALRAGLRRRGLVQGVAVGVVLLFGLLAVMTATSAWPAWQGNHGRGGEVITVDRFTSVTSDDDGRGPRTWSLGTGQGTAIAESGRPRIGQRWTLSRDLFGNLRAYRVGGFDYLLVGALFLFSAVCVLGALFWQGVAIRTELRLRRAAGDHDLATDIARLAGGVRPQLLLDGEVVGTLVLPTKAGVNAARKVLLGRVAATGGVIIGAGGLAVLLVVQRVSLLRGPPYKRDVVLPYLTSAGWEPSVLVQYRFQEGKVRDLREWAGPGATEVTGVRGLDVDPVLPENSFAPHPTSLDVTVARVGSVPEARLRAGFRAEYDVSGYRVTPVTGLADGWTGLYRLYPTYRDGELHAYWVSDGVSVEVVLDDFYLEGSAQRHYTAEQLTRILAPLTRTLTRVGTQRLELDTARPAHA